MNHSFKNLPRAKEVNEQQGTMYSTKASFPGNISFGEFQEHIYVRAQQLLKGKEEDKNNKMVFKSSLRKAITSRLINRNFVNEPSNANVSNLEEEETTARPPKSILRNRTKHCSVNWSLVTDLNLLTDDDDGEEEEETTARRQISILRNMATQSAINWSLITDLNLLTDDDEEEEEGEEETFEAFLSVEQSNCLNADSHVGSQKKTQSESKADEASSHISIHNETKSSRPKRNARRHHINAYTGRRINGKVICSQDARSYLASFRKKRNARKYPCNRSLVIYRVDDDEEEKSISSLMHATSQQKIQKKNGTPITDEIEKIPNARFARNITKSSNVVRKDRITVAIKKSFRGSYRDRSDTYLRQFELDSRETVCSTDLHKQWKVCLRGIARRQLYIPADRCSSLIARGDQNSKGKWQGKHFHSSLSIVEEEEVELDVSTLAPNENLFSSTRTPSSSSTTLATSPPSVTIESTKPELGLNTSSTASSIASAVISSSRPSDPFPSSQPLFKNTKNGKRRKLNAASDGIINPTYSRSTSLPSPAPSPPPPVEISVMAMANDCQMQKEISTKDSDIPFQNSLASTSPERRQTSEQESPLQQTNVSTYCLSSRQDGYNDIAQRKRRKRYRRSATCTSQHSHTISLVQGSSLTNENVPTPFSSSLAQS